MHMHGEPTFSGKRDAQEVRQTLADFLWEGYRLNGPNKNQVHEKGGSFNTMFSQESKAGNAFKWKLLGADYDPALFNELPKALMLKY